MRFAGLISAIWKAGSSRRVPTAVAFQGVQIQAKHKPDRLQEDILECNFTDIAEFRATTDVLDIRGSEAAHEARAGALWISEKMMPRSLT